MANAADHQDDPYTKEVMIEICLIIELKFVDILLYSKYTSDRANLSDVTCAQANIQ